MSQYQRAFMGAALLTTALHAGCDGGFDHATANVYGKLNVIDRAGSVLNSVGTLVAVDGLYGDDCQYRSTGGGFMLPLGDYSGVPQGARLAVRRGDSGCTIKLTHIEVIEPSASTRIYTIDPARPLSQAYQDSAATCHSQNLPPAFFTNARLRSSGGTLFDNDYFIDLVYSDDPLRIDQEVQSQYATVRAVVQALGVPTPDYAPDNSGLLVSVDARGQLTPATSGQLSLLASEQPAQRYMLSATDPGSTATSINVAYRAGQPIAISGGPLVISAAELGLLADSALPITRYLILANFLGSDPATRSYQVFVFRFRVP